ncbi:MAG: ribosome biogenesis GTP-binding protein YihA/YsxC [Gammaproteobacteria bacterium]
MPLDFRRLQFLTSAATPTGFPPDAGREVAFAGRSNAGKSSVLNALAGVAGLARVSKTPGRTRLANFFTLDVARRFVDLPGYGYAAAPATVRAGWEGLMQGYFAARRALAGLVLVMDIRQAPTGFDRQLLDWLAPRGLPVLALLNKSDKLSRSAAQRVLERCRVQMPGAMQLQIFSARTGTGVEAARAVLAGWLAGSHPDSG